jgi:hypothetical protein
MHHNTYNIVIYIQQFTLLSLYFHTPEFLIHRICRILISFVIVQITNRFVDKLSLAKFVFITLSQVSVTKEGHSDC